MQTNTLSALIDYELVLPHLRARLQRTDYQWKVMDACGGRFYGIAPGHPPQRITYHPSPAMWERWKSLLELESPDEMCSEILGKRVTPARAHYLLSDAAITIAQQDQSETFAEIHKEYGPRIFFTFCPWCPKFNSKHNICGHHTP